MTDTLRENLGKALECELRELLRTKEAPYMDLAEACQSAARAALAAAPLPAPAPAADERDEIERIICDAFTCDLRGRGDEDGAFWQTAADALLARGLRLPGGNETMAWAVVGSDGKMVAINYDRMTAQHLCNPGERIARVAIRVVEEGDDGA